MFLQAVYGRVCFPNHKLSELYSYEISLENMTCILSMNVSRLQLHSHRIIL